MRICSSVPPPGNPARSPARHAVALAFDEQVLPVVPFDDGDAGDELVDIVLTPTRVIGPRSAAWA